MSVPTFWSEASATKTAAARGIAVMPVNCHQVCGAKLFACILPCPRQSPLALDSASQKQLSLKHCAHFAARPSSLRVRTFPPRFGVYVGIGDSYGKGNARGSALVRASHFDFEGGDNNRDSGGQSDGEGEGDVSEVSRELQRLLVQQVRLQLGERQVEMLVEESGQQLRSSVRDGMAQELDRIATRAMRGADDFSDRVLKRLDASALSIERDLLLARKEMEAREREFEKFQSRVYLVNNEGLFFKGLYSPPSRPSSSRGPTNKRHSTRQQGTAGAAAGSPVPGTPQDDTQLVAGRSGSGRKGAASGLVKQVLHLGLSLTCVSFLWSSAASFLVDHHFMRSQKLLEYAFVFVGFVLINAGYEASAKQRPQAPPVDGVEH